MPTITLPDRDLRAQVRAAISESASAIQKKGVPWHTLYGIRDGSLRELPSVATIRALANALGLTETETLLGLAVIVGLEIPEAEHLPG